MFPRLMLVALTFLVPASAFAEDDFSGIFNKPLPVTLKGEFDGKPVEIKMILKKYVLQNQVGRTLSCAGVWDDGYDMYRQAVHFELVGDKISLYLHRFQSQRYFSSENLWTGKLVKEGANYVVKDTTAPKKLVVTEKLAPLYKGKDEFTLTVDSTEPLVKLLPDTKDEQVTYTIRFKKVGGFSGNEYKYDWSTAKGLWISKWVGTSIRKNLETGEVTDGKSEILICEDGECYGSIADAYVTGFTPVMTAKKWIYLDLRRGNHEQEPEVKAARKRVLKEFGLE